REPQAVGGHGVDGDRARAGRVLELARGEVEREVRRPARGPVRLVAPAPVGVLHLDGGQRAGDAVGLAVEVVVEPRDDGAVPVGAAPVLVVGVGPRDVVLPLAPPLHLLAGDEVEDRSGGASGSTTSRGPTPTTR